MLLFIIFTFIYIISFYSLKSSYLYCFKKGLWLEEDSQVEFYFFIPIFNTLMAIFHWVWIYLKIEKKK